MPGAFCQYNSHSDKYQIPCDADTSHPKKFLAAHSELSIVVSSYTIPLKGLETPKIQQENVYL